MATRDVLRQLVPFVIESLLALSGDGVSPPLSDDGATSPASAVSPDPASPTSEVRIPALASAVLLQIA